MLERLADRLSALGEQHAGVHFATIGWILPMLHDPDGHEVRFYTTDHHTDYSDEVLVIEDPRETAERRGAGAGRMIGERHLVEALARSPLRWLGPVTGQCVSSEWAFARFERRATSRTSRGSAPSGSATAAPASSAVRRTGLRQPARRQEQPTDRDPLRALSPQPRRPRRRPGGRRRSRTPTSPAGRSRIDPPRGQRLDRALRDNGSDDPADASTSRVVRVARRARRRRASSASSSRSGSPASGSAPSGSAIVTTRSGRPARTSATAAGRSTRRW